MLKEGITKMVKGVHTKVDIIRMLQQATITERENKDQNLSRVKKNRDAENWESR